jgi:hypothetical protein
MQSFKTFLNERFINALPKDEDIKRKYADAVWNVLQYSYKGIGGIKGSGFENKESMIQNIPMWKMGVKNGKVVAVILYKDKGGRKSVAMGADGSDVSKEVVKDMMRNDFQRSYGEKSKGALGALLKSVPFSVLEPFLLTPEQAGKLFKKDTIGLDKYDGELPPDAVRTLEKYPELRKYGYMRDLGGKMIFKVAVGVPGKKIT